MSENRNKLIRIAITGPESTGKSTLSKQLAHHYDTVWAREFARTYIDKLDRPYDKNDLLEITKGQLNEEDTMAKKANQLLFCDTELLVIKIWSEHKYGRVDSYIISEIEKRHYDLYLLTYIDLPWRQDDQREHPEKRDYFFDWYKRELKSMGANYHVIQGSNEERLNNSIYIIDHLLDQIIR